MSNCWKNVLVEPTSTLIEALEIINDEALRVVVVVDSNDYLLGVVTDGDIRRGLLRNLPLTAEVSQVMNKNPYTADADTSRDDLITIMERNNILSIPLLRNNKVVGLETLHHALSKPLHQNPVFIMAGGFGTRLKPLTDKCPKPMLNVGGKPILETVIRSFIKAGFVNFYISTHFMPKVIQDYFGDGSGLGINITYIYEETPLGTGGALGLLPKELQDGLPIIMINGDVLTNIDFQRVLDFHIENNATATVCVREYEYQIPYGVISGEGSRIKNMVEKPIQHFFINAGIYVVAPSVLKSIPVNHHIDMPSLLDLRMNQGDDILMFPIYEYWLDIGQMDDFNRAQADIYSLGVL